jgi:hypothetical protein
LITNAFNNDADYRAGVLLEQVRWNVAHMLRFPDPYIEAPRPQFRKRDIGFTQFFWNQTETSLVKYAFTQ